MNIDPLPERPPESSRSILATALTFLGPIISVAGSLALIRTRHVVDVAPAEHWFYLALIPIGLIVWVVGFTLKSRLTAAQRREDNNRD